MAVTLMPLPYDKDALAPAISAETLEFHHGKHHQTYVDKTNAAIEGTDLANASLEDIVKASRGKPALFNNAAQVWNHGFYWASLAPKSAAPSGALAAAIDASFGSLDALTKRVPHTGAGHCAWGWVWLAAAAEGKLCV